MKIFRLTLLFAAAALLSSSCQKHFISDAEVREAVHKAFEERRAHFTQGDIFAIFDQGKMTSEERGAMEFLYSAMSSADMGDYEGDIRNHFYSCQAGVSVGSVLIDGSIGACPSIRANYNQGNIYKDDFWEVWQNRYEVYRDREWKRTGICADCNMFRYCQGNGMHLRDNNGSLLNCNLKKLYEKE